MKCFFCGKELEMTDRVGRSERCPHCDRDLHICKNCGFYDTTAYNECREPQAERVLDKEKSNFCDYFVFRRGRACPAQGAASGAPTDPAAEAKRKLEELFRK